MNKVVLMGRTTRDVEARYSGETAVTRMTLAVDRRIKKESEGQQADFISCVAFGKTAEFLGKYGTNLWLRDGSRQEATQTARV